ncbi:hypothetical protein FED29_017875 [Aeromonas veronii]|nr:hypothetical protein [Aeromonas veronii]
MNTKKFEQLAENWTRLRNLPSPMDFEGDYQYVKRSANDAPYRGAEKTPDNPSRKAVLRVSNPLPVPSSCNICGELAVRIGTHGEVYGREYSDWPYVYLCECCGSYVGLHPFTAIPLGTLADRKTREARKSCKEPFERLHRTGVMSREQAYAWLAKAMGIPTGECHFGWFTAEQCTAAKALCLGRLSHKR